MSGTGGEELLAVAPAPVGLARRIAAWAIWAIHVAVSAFVLMGWALPWPAAWWIYVIGAPLIHVGWIVFDDYCWLLILEARLRHEPLVVGGEDDQAEPRVFVGELIESIIRRPVPRRVSNWINYSVLWGGFATACARLYLAD